MIGIIIPGTPIITGGPIETNNVIVDVNNPKNVHFVSMFLTQPIPNDSGVSLYYSVPPFNSKQFIGCVCNARPTDTFNTGWSLDPNVNIYSSIKLGAQIEKLSNIEMAYKEKIKLDINQDYAKKVVNNLYHYLDSFDLNKDSNSKLMAVPMKTLENWYNKFMTKYKVDPNFLMKNDE